MSFLLWTRNSGAQTVACACLTTLLVACGGGTDSDVGSGATRNLLSEFGAIENGTDLQISEVATNYYSDDVAWFEVFNPTGSPVSLADYTLRSSYIDMTTRAKSDVPAAFLLPDVVVPSKGYLVVAAKTFIRLRNNNQMAYVRDGSNVPFWNAHGSVELLRAGQTIDFVRFGNSSAAPVTAELWRGSNVPALPSGANQHGKSIVRLGAGNFADTDTAADWALVNFATPAGPNDVAPGIIDSDNDGIPDSAKREGGTYAGLDLYAMGARPGRRDVFIETDYMKGTDPALTPRKEALKKVVDAFALRNIGVHIDTGALHGEALGRDNFNLGGGNAVDFARCVELSTSGEAAREGCTSFYDFKASHFDVRRSLVFHYALFANSLKLDGSAGSSGVAEMNGNDLIVSLGGYGFTTAPGNSLNMLINLQASTLMHELGHNFGLRHGGNEDINYKPNHYSVMNYMYQFAGLSATPNSLFAAERYYLTAGLKNKTYCNLVENSPCSSDFRIDFSDGSGMALDENSLLEGNNIGRGAVAGAYADWDNNSAFSTSQLSLNINPKDGSSRSVLRDFDEWSNLAIPFARGRSGNNYGEDGMFVNEKEVLRSRSNPMNWRARSRIVEDALPAEFQRNLKENHGWHHEGKKRYDKHDKRD